MEENTRDPNLSELVSAQTESLFGGSSEDVLKIVMHSIRGKL